MTHAAISISEFPLVRHTNEPLSHLANSCVKQLIKLIPDVITETCSVPENLAQQYSGYSPYEVNASRIRIQRSFRLEDIIPVDGDGFLDIGTDCHYRLYGVDAPELFTCSFIKVNDTIFKRRNGHISHLGFHFYINAFSKPNGRGEILLESPKWHIDQDHYGRNLASLWVQWDTCPTESELAIIDKVIQTTRSSHDDVRQRLMTLIDPREASEAIPYMLNINALLVLAGFCLVYSRYCFIYCNIQR